MQLKHGSMHDGRGGEEGKVAERSRASQEPRGLVFRKFRRTKKRSRRCVPIRIMLRRRGKDFLSFFLVCFAC